jgi:hypothetical protein
MQTTTTITSLNQLSAAAPTRINPNTNVNIPGTYLDYDGNKTNSCAHGARWTLRAEGTDARLRDLEIG